MRRDFLCLYRVQPGSGTCPASMQWVPGALSWRYSARGMMFNYSALSIAEDKNGMLNLLCCLLTHSYRLWLCDCGPYMHSDYGVAAVVERRKDWAQLPLWHVAVHPSQRSLHSHSKHQRVDWVTRMQHTVVTSVRIATPGVQVAHPVAVSTVHVALRNRWQVLVKQQSIRWAQEEPNQTYFPCTLLLR